jgi:hypothetical protein
MKYALRLLVGLMILAVFGGVVGAIAGAVAGWLIGLGDVLFATQSLPHSVLIGFDGLRVGALLGIPAGWLAALPKRKTGASLLVGGYVAVLGASQMTQLHSVDAILLLKIGVCVAAAAWAGRSLFIIQRRLRRGSFGGTASNWGWVRRPASALAWAGVTLTMLGVVGAGQIYRCWRHGNGEWHLAQNQNELLRLIAHKYEEAPCLCSRPERIELWSLSQVPADPNLRHTEYLVSSKTLTVEADPGSGWSERWENLSVDDLRRLARQGATFDTLTRRGYSKRLF